MPSSEDSTRGFLSYVRDEYRSIRSLLKFKTELQRTINSSLGSRDFAIYHDRSDLSVGEKYETEIRDAINGAFFFFAMVSRSYFRNPNTRQELQIALATRDRKGTGNYYIVPLYTLQGPDEIYNDPDLQTDELINFMRSIAMVDVDDWRNQLYQHLHYLKAERNLRVLGERLANQIRTRPPPRSYSEGVDVGESSIGGRHVVVEKGGKSGLIQAAINAAADGDEIYVEAGEYLGSLILSKPLNLIGAGIGKVYIKASGSDVLHIQAASGRITGFSFVQHGKTGFGVSISRGRAELNNCEIISSGHACLSVQSGADPTVLKNLIRDGAQAGILVHDEGLGTFEDNEIRNCEYANVEVADKSNPTFRRNKIHHGHRGGIYIRDFGKGRFEDNRIYRNYWSNVSVALHGTPFFKNNWIRSSSDVGVDIQENGGGEFEGNVICWNRKNGVRVSKQGSPVFRRNSIHDNTESGVYITEGGLGVLEANEISGNMHAGVAIHGVSSPKVLWNTISRNRQQGIQILDPGDLIIENNLLIRNSDVGITINAIIGTVRANRIEENGTYGIVCTADDDQEAAVAELGSNNWFFNNCEGSVNRMVPKKKEKEEQAEASVNDQ